VAQGGLTEHAPDRCLHSLAQTGLGGAGKIDLAIQGSQQLDRLDTAVVVCETAAVVDELVGQVIEGMSQLLEAASSVGSNPAPHGGAEVDCWAPVERCDRERDLTLVRLGTPEIHDMQVCQLPALLSLLERKLARTAAVCWGVRHSCGDVTMLTNNRCLND
jgi:hypothetical protein